MAFCFLRGVGGDGGGRRSCTFFSLFNHSDPFLTREGHRPSSPDPPHFSPREPLLSPPAQASRLGEGVVKMLKRKMSLSSGRGPQRTYLKPAPMGKDGVELRNVVSGPLNRPWSLEVFTPLTSPEEASLHPFWR